MLDLLGKCETPRELAELLRARLLGDDLGYPYLIEQGESPEHAIVNAWEQLHRAGDNAFVQRFDKAMVDLVDEVLDVLLCVSIGSSRRQPELHLPLTFGLTTEEIVADDRVHRLLQSPYLLYCLRLCNVAAQTGQPRDKRRIVAWAIKLYGWLNCSDEAISLFTQIIASLGPLLQDADAVVPRSFSLEAVKNPFASAPILSTFAKWNPIFLKKHLLPQFAAHFAQCLMDPVAYPQAKKTVSQSLFTLFATPISDEERLDIINTLASLSRDGRRYFHFELFDAVKKIGLLNKALELDRLYWQSCEMPKPIEDPAFHHAWQNIFAQLRLTCSGRYSGENSRLRRKTYKIAVPLFAEGALMLFFALVIETVLDVSVKIIFMSWQETPRALEKGEIDIALGNITMRNDSSMAWSDVVYEWIGYDIVARKDWIKEVIQSRTKENRPVDLLCQLLMGNVLRSQNEILKEEYRDELRSILENAQSTSPYGTDMYVVFAKLVDLIGVAPKYDDLDENNGLDALAHGTVHIYAGGSNHAYYLTARFPEECVRIITLEEGEPMPVYCRLLVRKYKGGAAVVSPDVLETIWWSAIGVWNQFAYSDTRVYNQDIKKLPREPLAEYILAKLNSVSAGRFWSFDELARVLRQHTITNRRTLEIRINETREDASKMRDIRDKEHNLADLQKKTTILKVVNS